MAGGEQKACRFNFIFNRYIGFSVILSSSPLQSLFLLQRSTCHRFVCCNNINMNYFQKSIMPSQSFYYYCRKIIFLQHICYMYDAFSIVRYDDVCLVFSFCARFPFEITFLKLCKRTMQRMLAFASFITYSSHQFLFAIRDSGILIIRLVSERKCLPVSFAVYNTENSFRR